MGNAVLVVVDGDGAVHRALASALTVGPVAVDVVPCLTARGALNACCAIEPDCVLTELSLPDLEGMWLVAALRKQPSRVGSVPIIMTSRRDDEEIRLQALHGGVDVFLSKPLDPAETASQVRALVEMASRLRDQRSSVLPAEWTASGRRRAIVGDLNRMSVATVLTALELERRSGDLVLKGGGTVAGGAGRLVLNLAEGVLVGGWQGNAALSPLDAMRLALHWPGRRFEFVPSEERRVASSAGSGVMGALVLQALRMDEDEEEEVTPEEEATEIDDVEELVEPAAFQPLAPVLEPPTPDPSPRARIRSGTIPRVSAASPTEAVARAPGKDLVETVLPGRRPDPRAEPLERDLARRRPDPRAEPLELDLDEDAPLADDHAPPAAEVARTRSATKNRIAGTDWMDDATTLKMRR